MSSFETEQSGTYSICADHITKYEISFGVESIPFYATIISNIHNIRQ